MTWHNAAACAGHPNPELWFPQPGNRDISEALSICATCPVQAQCHAFAQEHHTTGVWGGQRRGSVAARRYRSPLTGDDSMFMPHGTAAAIRRHQRKGELLCLACTFESRAINARRCAARGGAS